MYYACVHPCVRKVIAHGYLCHCLYAHPLAPHNSRTYARYWGGDIVVYRYVFRERERERESARARARACACVHTHMIICVCVCVCVDASRSCMCVGLIMSMSMCVLASPSWHQHGKLGRRHLHPPGRALKPARHGNAGLAEAREHPHRCTWYLLVDKNPSVPGVCSR
jgi:hypothetical protein